MCISSLFINTLSAYAQQVIRIPVNTGSLAANTLVQARTTLCPLPDPVSTQTINSAPETCIVSAVDGRGIDLISTGTRTTPSASITFGVSGNIVHAGDPPIKRFDCGLDTQVISSCAIVSPAQNNVKISLSASGLSMGSHIFVVKAVNTADQSASTAANFTWTVTTSNPSNPVLSFFPSSNAAATNQALSNLTNNELTASAARSQSIQNTQNADIVTAVTEANSAANLASALNPPLLKCERTDNDLAIYKIAGKADLSEILKIAGKTTIPVNFMLLADPNPTDPANQIVGQNNRYITGKLVAFPGDTHNQKVVDVQLTKIDTECKATAIISEREIIHGKSHQPPQPAIVPPRSLTQNLDPPFSPCSIATQITSGQSNPISLPAAASAIQNQITSTATKPAQPFVLLPAGPNSASVLGTQGAGIQQLGPTGITNFVSPGTSTSTSSALQAANNVFTSGISGSTSTADIAKYVIRGKINTADFKQQIHGSPNIVLTLYVDLNPFTPPPIKASAVRDTSDLIAATLQVNPGDTHKWQVAGFLVDEIYTACETTPFVSRPLTIGQDASDFSTQFASNQLRDLDNTKK